MFITKFFKVQNVGTNTYVEFFPFSPSIVYTGRFIMFSVITHIYKKKTKGPNLMELFTATGKLQNNLFDN
jgi:hypothetical protein